MQFTGAILDDLLNKIFAKLLRNRHFIVASRGRASELYGVTIELKNPRARLSRTETRGKPFSSLGELLWYLSRDNKLEFIRNYIPKYEQESEDGETVYGGYGPRLFNQRRNNQIRNVVEVLRKNDTSRRAVIQIFNAEDISRRHIEIPCTCTMQFLVRRGRLHLLVNMRSNDVYMGLPHDIFCFTMLQEIVARSLGVEVGTYKQFVGSFHLYDEDRDAARQYLDEKFQAFVAMPEMPIGDPWPSILKLLDAELRIRNKFELVPGLWQVDSYWRDLIHLLQIFAATGDSNKIDAIKENISSPQYAPYIESRRVLPPHVNKRPNQLILL